MLGDRELVGGGVRRFSPLKCRSHKLKRAARSPHAAEVFAIGAAGASQGARDQIVEMLYGPVARGAGMKLSYWQIPMTIVTDSKDRRDWRNSDAGVGRSAQGSVNLELAGITC